MKKLVILAAVFVLVSTLGCKGVKPKPGPGAGNAEHKQYDVKYWGYKRAVKIKATPDQVDEYLMDPGHLASASKTLKLKMISNGRMEKRGDHVTYKAQALGVPLNITLTLWDRDPGKEALLICLVNDSTMGFIRYHLRKLEDGTKFAFEFDVEESNPLLENLIETMKLDQTIMKLQDENIAKMKAHFDPDVNEEEEAGGEPRGENYYKLFQANEVSVWINAGPDKVREYLTASAFTDMMRSKYSVDFGKTFIEGKTGCVYRAGAVFLGTHEDSDLLVLSNEVDKPIMAYLAAALPSRISIIARPARGGTQFTLAFMTMPPTAFTAELANALNNSGQIPKVVERVLLDIKTGVEGAV